MPLDLQNGLALRCYSRSLEVWIAYKILKFGSSPLFRATLIMVWNDYLGIFNNLSLIMFELLGSGMFHCNSNSSNSMVMWSTLIYKILLLETKVVSRQLHHHCLHLDLSCRCSYKTLKDPRLLIAALMLAVVSNRNTKECMLFCTTIKRNKNIFVHPFRNYLKLSKSAILIRPFLVNTPSGQTRLMFVFSRKIARYSPDKIKTIRK